MKTKKPARKAAAKKAPLKDETVLILRTCAPDGSSWGGFKYPESGQVEAPDWDPSPKIECGNGLHGLRYGVGDNGHLKGERWQVIRALAAEVVDSSAGGKVRFRRGEIIYSGAMVGAYALVNAALLKIIQEAAKKAKGQHASKDETHAAATGNYGHAAATGNYGHAAATGDYGHAAATGNSGHAAATGNYGHAAATGYSGHAAATGYSGHAAATGNYGHAAATGDYGHAAATGKSGHAAATGDYGHAAATGNYGHAAATGYSGHAAATGDSGHAAATGDYAIAAAVGANGRAKAGKDGAVVVGWWDETAKRPRVVVGYVGENGVKTETWYGANASGQLVETEA